jgi:uncharacterized membrane protein
LEKFVRVEIAGMIGLGLGALLGGIVFARPRVDRASGADKLIVLGPVFEAVALAIFAAEHFTAARDLAPIVPRWLPAHLFWVYFFGAALLAAAVSFILGRWVRWSAALLALFFLIIVTTIDVPNLPANFHDRFFWILTFRESAFGAGAMVLAGSFWPSGARAGAALVRIGRTVVAAVMTFYAVQHFLFPRHVPGVPLEKLTPAWIPAPVLLSWIVGLALLLGGVGLLTRPTLRIASAGAGAILLLLTAFFYVPILMAEFRTAPVEGLNYVGDTLLFAATVLLAGFTAGLANPSEANSLKAASAVSASRSE